MRISLEWLKEYVEVPCQADELASRLAEQGFEVEAMTRLDANFSGVIAAKIIALDPHPEADDLQVARVEVGAGKAYLTVVTSAKNIAIGNVVPLALPGARLGTMEIGEQKLRGVNSTGMFCSSVELGLGEDASGILILPGDLEIGADLKQALHLTADDVLEVAILQRADCLGYIHMAKEVAAALRTKWTEPDTSVAEQGGDATAALKVTVEAPDLCPRYAARLITDVQLRPSPWWMTRRLLAAGIRPINNLVDITNYVMLEMNQPLHAFDYDSLRQGRVVVRRARQGETLVTLDGVTRQLNPDMLVIADAEVPIGIAGVMGGESSEITSATKNVLLESACFDSLSNRKTGISLGLRSEAGLRFGKGIDPNGVVKAMNRAAHLIEQLGVGKVARGYVDIYRELPAEKEIVVRPQRVNKLLGTKIPVAAMIDCLERLPFKLERQGADEESAIKVTVPTFRGDITQEADLIEEIARIYGYDNIPVSFPASFAMGRLSESKEREQTMRSIMSGLGLNEIYSWSMIDPAVFDRLGLPEDHRWRNAPKIMNPMSTEQSIMRPSLLPGMLEVASYNARRRQQDLRLFEIGRVFGPLPSGGQELPEEDTVLGMIACGRSLPANWRNAGFAADFFEMKGIIEALLRQSGVREVTFEPVELPAMHPGRTARILAGVVELGYFGEIHPEICSRYDLPATYFAQLNLKRLFDASKGITYQPLPKFPDVERDIALLVPESVPASRVTECVLKAGGELLEKISLFDVYQGEQIASGWRSLAYSLSFRHPERTLTDADVSKLMEAILDAAATEVGARRR
ncbi:MAG: phenylalanine--tRNA ligase subunit beta [Bacillota bacterium]|jgi:phenylalanyl-tRNA synthetase beta chain